MTQSILRVANWTVASLMLVIVVVLGYAPCAWGAESSSEGIWLEKDSLHFKMAACPICKANPVLRDYLDHAYHASPSVAEVACKITPEILVKELESVRFEGEGVVNDQTMLGTLTAYGPEETMSDCVRVVPRVLGTQNIIVQVYTGTWYDRQKAGTPARLTLTTSTLPAAEIESPSSVSGSPGSVVDVLGTSEASNSLLTMNEAAVVVSRVHPQVILSVVSSDPSVVKVEQVAFDSATAPDGNPYTGYRVRYMRPGHAVISVKDALGGSHTVDVAVEDKALQPTSLAKASVSVKAKAWTGKTLKPAAPTVKLGSKTLRSGVDYAWSCKGGRAVGSYKVTVTGKGAYAGTKTATFKIVPKGTSVKKLTKAKRAFAVKWKKPSKAALKQTTGYQVRWSTSKKFAKKATKLKTVKATTSAGKKCSLKVSKLKAKKKYYVQVRAYKKVGKATYYSSWSKAKAVKTNR